MSDLSIFLLGEFIASLDDRPLFPPLDISAKALLIYLVCEADRPHQTAALMELLWPDLPPTSARGNLHHALELLREAIPGVAAEAGEGLVPLILVEGQSIRINPAASYTLDVDSFTNFIDDDPARATSMYRDDFLVDFQAGSNRFEEWSEAKRAKLRRLVLDGLEDLAGQSLAAGAYKEAQKYAWRQLELDDLRESAVRQLMVALNRCGYRNGALAQYQRFRRRLSVQLGVEPGAETSELYQNIHADALREAESAEVATPPVGEGRPIFLFTDIERSTPLWEQHRESMLEALLQHNAILEKQIPRHGGRILELRGDGVKAVFEGVDPLPCVLAIQREFGRADWGRLGDLRIRIGLHGVPADLAGHDYFIRDGNYYGPVLNQAARIMDAGHGGQILVSEPVRAFFTPPPGASWQDFGRHHFKGIYAPVKVYGLLHPDLPHRQFPPLRLSPDRPDVPEPEPVRPPAAASFPHNLPVETGQFVGREAELAELARLVADPAARLVTVVAPGGMGKSRLALAFARSLLEPGNEEPAYPDGVFVVALDKVEGVEQIAPAIVGALDLQLSIGDTPPEQLWAYLADKQMLLLLDNFEHLLPAGADKVEKMVQGAPDMQFLVTSRERLGLPAEQVYALGGLDFPVSISEESSRPVEDGEAFSAFRLFLQVARRLQPDYQLAKAEDGKYLAQICRLAGGMPLALELAAGWVEMLPLAEIAAEIQGGLDLLETEMRGIPSRHRSIQAVFDATWSRLSPAEQEVLARLSIFQSGFSRLAAKKVAGASLRLLLGLVRKSLLQAAPGPDRQQMQPLLRQYARARLAESGHLQAVKTAHSHYYLGMVQARTADIKGRQQIAALKEIAYGFGDIQGAWAWAVANGTWQPIGEAVEGLFWFGYIRARWFDVEPLFWSALEQIPPDPDPEIKEIELRLRAYWLRIGWNTGHRDLPAAELHSLQQETLMALRSVDDPAALAITLHSLHSLHDGPSPEYLAHLQEALELCQKAGDQFLEQHVLDYISWQEMEMGRREQRFIIARRRLDMARQAGDRFNEAESLWQLGSEALNAGDFDTARKRYAKAKEIFELLGDSSHLAFITRFEAELAFAEGNFEQASSILKEAEVTTRRYNLPFEHMLTEAARGWFGCVEERYAEAIALCQEAADYDTFFGFIGLTGLVYANLGVSNLVEARRRLRQGFQNTVQLKYLAFMTQLMPAAALVAAHEGMLPRAAELLSLALHQPADITRWMEKFPLIARLRARLESDLTPEAWAAAWESGQSLDLEETAETLIGELSSAE